MTNETISAVFARRLIAAREARGLSQRALGDALGLGKKTGSTRINRYERQSTVCDIKTAAEIAKQLGVPTAYLFAESDELADLIILLSRLSKTEKSKVAAEIRSHSLDPAAKR